MAKQAVAATGWKALVLSVIVTGGTDGNGLLADYDPAADDEPSQITVVEYPVAAWMIDDATDEATPISAIGDIGPDAIMSPEGACVLYADPNDPTAGTPYRNQGELLAAVLAATHSAWEAEQE